MLKKLRIYAAAAAAALVFAAGCATAAPKIEAQPDPASTGRKLSGELLARDKYRFVGPRELARPDLDLHTPRTLNYTAMHYAEACAGFGALRLAEQLGDKEMTAAVVKRYRKFIEEGPVNTGGHVDANVFGILPLEMYIQTGEKVFLDSGIRLADMQWEKTTPDGITVDARYWIDDMWMSGSLQTQAWRATKDKKYLDRAALLLTTYCDRLQRPEGLFYHGETEPFFWGRGNGWVAASMAFLLSELPADHPKRAALVADYEKMMAALLKNQAPSGMWRQLIDHPESYEESSCTAMFGYSMACGVRTGLLKDPAYAAAASKAWTGLNAHIGADGKVTDICIGTSKSKDLQFYLNRPKDTADLHGQAPAMWFAAEMVALGK